MFLVVLKFNAIFYAKDKGVPNTLECPFLIHDNRKFQACDFYCLIGINNRDREKGM